MHKDLFIFKMTEIEQNHGSLVGVILHWLELYYIDKLESLSVNYCVKKYNLKNILVNMR